MFLPFFIRSGIRYDYLLEDTSQEFISELVQHYVSGQLRVAPEHCSATVLDKMGKPHIEAYKKFSQKLDKATEKIGKEQYLVPYVMSSHPGCTMKEAVELAQFLKRENIHPEQVQDFYPTPGTISTCMFYTGIDPYTMKEVYVPKKPEEKAMQRALMQWFIPKNKDLVFKALKIAGRLHLAGSNKNCLITASKGFVNNQNKKQNNKQSSRKNCKYKKSRK